MKPINMSPSPSNDSVSEDLRNKIINIVKSKHVQRKDMILHVLFSIDAPAQLMSVLITLRNSSTVYHELVCIQAFRESLDKSLLVSRGNLNNLGKRLYDKGVYTLIHSNHFHIDPHQIYKARNVGLEIPTGVLMIKSDYYKVSRIVPKKSLE